MKSKQILVKGSYTYKVEKIIEADNEQEAIDIALNHSKPMCEWDSQDQDTYSEEVESAEEVRVLPYLFSDDYLTNYNNADEHEIYGVNPLDYEK